MRFTDWETLENVSSSAPQEAGLFQLKVREGLLNYPHGKSAMFYYGYAGNLRAGLQNFLSTILPLLEINAGALLVRWLSAEDTQERFQNHLNNFYSKFGSLPLGNEMLLKTSEIRGQDSES